QVAPVRHRDSEVPKRPAERIRDSHGRKSILLLPPGEGRGEGAPGATGVPVEEACDSSPAPPTSSAPPAGRGPTEKAGSSRAAPRPPPGLREREARDRSPSPPGTAATPTTSG